MTRRVAIPLVIAALAAAGCGGSGGGSSDGSGSGDSGGSSQGAQLFADAGCKTCHTLKAAGANGTVGPNLDQLQPSAALVTKQVKNGGGGMPSFKGTLSPAQIRAVADYVSGVAGKG